MNSNAAFWLVVIILAISGLWPLALLLAFIGTLS